MFRGLRFRGLSFRFSGFVLLGLRGVYRVEENDEEPNGNENGT